MTTDAEQRDVLDGGRVARAEVMIAARDGITLATDLYFPAEDGRPLPGPFPVLLERTPYDKRGTRAAEITAANRTPMPQAEMAGYFVRAGYVVAIQDCRGRYRSEGHFEKYVGEAEDGYDTLDWLVRQPWGIGRIGTFGLSYCAHTQMAAACLSPPGLAGMILDLGGFSDAFQGGIRQGGAFELKQATWAYNQARESPLAKADPAVAAALAAEDLRDWFSRMPWKPGHSPVASVPEYEDYLFSQWRAECFDDEWKRPGLYGLGYIDRIPDVPILVMSSWYDPYPRTATDNFVALRNAGRSKPLSLVLGPWMHGRRSDSWSGDVDFGPAATLDGSLAANYLEFRRVFFDRIFFPERVRGPPDPVVRYFRMGGGSNRRNPAGRLDHGGAWKTAAEWPLPSVQLTDYFLDAGGMLSTAKPAREDATLSYDFDPSHPVPSIGGTITSGAPVMEGGAFDQREHPKFHGCKPPFLPLASRHDVLVFQTSALVQDLEVTGPITAELFVSVLTPDTDITIKLVDVHPPTPDDTRGFAMNVANGIQRLRFRDGYAEPKLLTPGQIYQIRVEAFPTSNLFKSGHRLRLDVSSSNFPHFDVNPNTGARASDGGPRNIARVTLHMGPSYRSRLILPVIPVQHKA